MKKETYFKKADELYDSIIPVQNDIRKKSEKCIRMYLEENGGYLDLTQIESSCVSVVYDGGNHPEYASNANSVVEAVFFDKDGDIALKIEDCDEYPLESLNWDEVYAVASLVQGYWKFN